MSAPIHTYLADDLTADVRQALDRLSRVPGAAHIAVMPDVHLAHDVCVGTVLATRDFVYPAAVGGDIGCGVATVAFDGAWRLDEAVAQRIIGSLSGCVPVRRHRVARPWPDALPAPPRFARIATHQLGTLGRGNHFLELQTDDDRLWLMVHSGSRGAGRAIRDRYGQGLASIAASSPSGRAYLAQMRWARAYAQANRAEILAAASQVVEQALAVKVDPETYLDCDHNHVAEEDGRWVHRKGAICAADGVHGLIPGSMGSDSFHTAGRGCREALCSSSHGAGRVCDRTTARRRFTPADLGRQMRGVHYDVRQAKRLVDEAPAAYRDIGKVMRAQRSLTRVVRRVRPLLSFKGG